MRVRAGVVTCTQWLLLFALLRIPGRASDFAALASQAAAARDANRVPEAIALYRQALAANAQWQEGWFYLGTLLYDSQQFAPARDAFRTLLRLHPNIPPALAFVGLCEFETGEFKDARKNIEEALSSGSGMDPQLESVLRFHDALLLNKTGDFDAALKAYLWFLQKQTGSPEMLTGLGLCALRSPRLPSELSPADRDFYTHAGAVMAAMLAGDARTAVPGIQSLIAKYPQAHYLHFLYGWFLISINPGAAAEQFKQELQITPDSAITNAMLAWSLNDWEEYKQALPYAEKAVRLDAHDHTAQYVLGIALNGAGQIAAAIPHLESAVQSDPTDSKALAALAVVYARNGDVLQARREREIATQVSLQEAPRNEHP